MGGLGVSGLEPACGLPYPTPGPPVCRGAAVYYERGRPICDGSAIGIFNPARGRGCAYARVCVYPRSQNLCGVAGSSSDDARPCPMKNRVLCVCVCVCGGGGTTVFTRSSRLDLHGHTGVLGSGRPHIGEAHGAGRGGVAILERKACRGLWAACYDEEGRGTRIWTSVRDGGWKEGSSPPHAALAKASASFGGAFMKLPCPRGHATPPGVVCVCVCVCVQGGRTILQREARMGPGPQRSPEAPA